MRRMIPQKLIDFVKILASLIGFTGNKIEVGNDLEVDGKVILNDADDLVDKEGNPLITGGDTTIVDTEEIVHSETEDGIELYLAQTISNKIQNSMQLPADAPDTEKLVAIGTNGAQKLVDPPSGGLKLYKHKITKGSDYLVVISTRSNPFTNIQDALDRDYCINRFYSLNSFGYFYPILYCIGSYGTYTIKYLDSNGSVISKNLSGNVDTDDVVEII